MEVVVFGSINIDVVTQCVRHPKAGETIIATGVNHYHGGKGANQAVAAARLGARVKLVGTVGRDLSGRNALEFLSASGVDISEVNEVDCDTGMAVVNVVPGGENTIVVVPGANTLANVRNFLDKIVQPVIAVAQFETPMKETKDLFERVVALGGTTILNPSPIAEIDPQLADLCSYIVLNHTEFQALYGAGSLEPRSLMSRLQALPPRHGNLIVTLGDVGFVMRWRGEAYEGTGCRVAAVDTTGAGDCFVGALAAELARGQDPFEAALFANAAAAASVTKSGAGPSMPLRSDVDELLACGKRTSIAY
jgi:ribokinase